MDIRLFRQRIRGPYLMLALAEAMTLIISVYVAAYLRVAGFDDPVVTDIETAAPLLARAITFSVVLLLAIASMGLYRAQRHEGLSPILWRISASFMIGALALMPLFYFIPWLDFGRSVFVLTVSVALTAVIMLRLGFLSVADNQVLKRRVLVYGTGEKALMVSDFNPKSAYSIVGYIEANGDPVHVPTEMVIRLNYPLVDFALQENVDEIVVAVQDRRQGLPLGELLNCRLSGIGIIDPTNFLERETGRLNLGTLSSGWIIFCDGFAQTLARNYSQRLFDVAASLSMLLVTLPILVTAALAIRLESGNGQPILYRQIRVGRNNKPFEILKFRSMRTDAEATGVALWATEGDSRITRVGAIMRKYRIDELPQILNVLRGDMSLVGPRPERPEFVVDLGAKIPFYSERHRVRPGLAGWAQMHYPYGDCEKDAYEKLQYDLYYIKNCSLFLDFMILLQTAEVIMWGKGAR